MMRRLYLGAAAGLFILSACQSANAPIAKFDQPALTQVLNAQSDTAKARYTARHPAQTIEFFAIAPGMTVLEALPGGGWYTKILLPYLGPNGRLEAGHYPDGMWPNIRTDQDWIDARIKDTSEWPDKAQAWNIDGAATIGSFQFTEMSRSVDGTADVVLFTRTLHNLNRYEDENGYFSAALSDAYRALKPGGTVGIVQHRAPESSAEDWADGRSGYLKQSYLIGALENAGFIFEASSEINANPKDAPTQSDVVWRLMPTLATTKENTPERTAIKAIGESDRMTLRFRKPK